MGFTPPFWTIFRNTAILVHGGIPKCIKNQKKAANLLFYFLTGQFKNYSYSFTMQSDFGGAEANIERIMLLANPVHTVNNANDEEALSRCKRANLKASI